LLIHLLQIFQLIFNAHARNTEQLKIVADLKNQTSEGGALEGSATQANNGLGD
jgi:hypothetical protein